MARRRSVALLLVLVVTVVTTMLTYAFVTEQSTTLGIIRNIENRSRSRHVAESGLRLAISYVLANDNWRTDQTNGVWAADVAIGEGTFTIVGEDGEDLNGDGIISIPSEGDGGLADDDSDSLTLRVTGRVNNAAYVATAVLKRECSP